MRAEVDDMSEPTFDESRYPSPGPACTCDARSYGEDLGGEYEPTAEDIRRRHEETIRFNRVPTDDVPRPFVRTLSMIHAATCPVLKSSNTEYQRPLTQAEAADELDARGRRIACSRCLPIHMVPVVGSRERFRIAKAKLGKRPSSKGWPTGSGRCS